MQVWGLALVKDDQYLVTGCNDNELQIWKINFIDNASTKENLDSSNLLIEEDDSDLVIKTHII